MEIDPMTQKDAIAREIEQEDRERDTFDLSKVRRGAVIATSARKRPITIRLDGDVIDWFKDQVAAQGGGSYQALMNATLRAHMEGQEARATVENLEAVLRRVIRDELAAH